MSEVNKKLSLKRKTDGQSSKPESLKKGFEGRKSSFKKEGFHKDGSQHHAFHKDRQDRRSFKTGKTSDKNAAAGSSSRAAAALCVNAIEEGMSLTEALPKFTRDLDDRDRAFVQEIVYGTLRHKRLLSTTASGLLDRGLNQKNNVARTLIICAIYQLLFTRAPAHAVVSSTVGACQLCRCKQLTALVNAVLRRFLREGAHLSHSADPCIEQSFPQWLYEELVQDYGEEKAYEIMRSSNEHAPMFIRVETSKISVENYLKALETYSMNAKAAEDCPGAVMLEEPAGVDKLPFFEQGYVAVQDLSAQKACLLLDLKEGQKVLDTCCAPGGKSAHILDITGGRADLTCTDIDEKRLEKTSENLRRLNYQPKVMLCDVSADISKLEGPFDRILVDAPCSGTGVIRRHPDIKWLRRKKDLEVLNATQEKILDNAFSVLKKGGILVYTTCSVLKSENEKQVEKFLSRHQDAKLLPFTMDGEESGFRQVLPGQNNADGFFYARFIKG